MKMYDGCTVCVIKQNLIFESKKVNMVEYAPVWSTFSIVQHFVHTIRNYFCGWIKPMYFVTVLLWQWLNYGHMHITFRDTVVCLMHFKTSGRDCFHCRSILPHQYHLYDSTHCLMNIAASHPQRPSVIHPWLFAGQSL